MKNEKFGILILVLASLVFGCEQKTESKKSDFRIAENYFDFENKMENNDTLNIGVVLFMCQWEEFDRVEITKTNDSIYLQIKEKIVMDDDPIYFPKVLYNYKKDTLSLGKMMTAFDIAHTDEMNLPSFIITNPKEKDTILLRTTGLSNRGRNIEHYQKIMIELYPNEMEKYLMEYFPWSELVEKNKIEMN